MCKKQLTLLLGLSLLTPACLFSQAPTATTNNGNNQNNTTPQDMSKDVVVVEDTPRDTVEPDDVVSSDATDDVIVEDLVEDIPEDLSEEDMEEDMCVPVALPVDICETPDETFCGTFTEPDSCGGEVSVDCGSCPSGGACESNQCFYERLTLESPQENALFGTSMSLHQNFLAVGVSAKPNAKNKRSGAVYVYTKDPMTGAWIVEDTVEIIEEGMPTNAEAQLFGAAVALHGDHLLVGAPAVPGLLGTGHSYLYRRDAMSKKWLFVKKFSGHILGACGTSVALSNDTAVVGCPVAERVQVFTKNAGGAWEETPAPKEPKGPRFADNFDFGFSLSLNNLGTLMVGAPHETVQGKSKAGRVYVFTRGSEGKWEVAQKVDAPVPRQNGRFGAAIEAQNSTSGARIAFGAPGNEPDPEPSNLSNLPGRVHLFKVANKRITHVQTLTGTDTNNDVFGVRLKLHKDTIFVTSAGIIPTDAYGQVHIFKPENNVWREQLILDSPFPEKEAAFGASLAADEQHLFVGAVFEDEIQDSGGMMSTILNVGSVYVLDAQAIQKEIEDNNP